jgi:Ragulator complex protein LAMTOR5
MTDNIICNDPNGLCLAASGDMDKKTSGVYTSLLRLASHLSDAGEPCTRIVIETKSATIHVMEYEGHAVAMKVPVVTPLSSTTTS